MHFIAATMSILPNHNYSIKSKCHILQRHRLLVSCSATTTVKPKPKNDQLAIKTHTLSQPLQDINRPVLNDPGLQSTWTHRAWLASGCTTVAFSLAKSIAGSATSHIWVEPIVAGLAGYIMADLGSGVYHWAIDNYGDSSTPIFGSQIEAFQGHHKWPWTITRRQFANNLHALARAVTFTVLPIVLACNDPVVHGFVGTCAGCIMFSQQFHAWAHGTKSKLPKVVLAMQDVGVLVSRSQHGAHHRAPYNNNYCIVSGVWNEFLDRNKVFEVLEMVLFYKTGVKPRSWSEPSSEWIEEKEDSSAIAAH